MPPPANEYIESWYFYWQLRELPNGRILELQRIAPRELIAGYWQEVGVSWNGGQTLHRHSLEDIE